jgi:hypothetical protein
VKKVVSQNKCGAACEKIFMMKLLPSSCKSSEIPVTVKTRLGWDNNSIIINEEARMRRSGAKQLQFIAEQEKWDGREGAD